MWRQRRYWLKIINYEEEISFKHYAVYILFYLLNLILHNFVYILLLYITENYIGIY